MTITSLGWKALIAISVRSNIYLNTDTIVHQLILEETTENLQPVVNLGGARNMGMGRDRARR
jgi:hypothetical protein